MLAANLFTFLPNAVWLHGKFVGSALFAAWNVAAVTVSNQQLSEASWGQGLTLGIEGPASTQEKLRLMFLLNCSHSPLSVGVEWGDHSDMF